MIINRFLFDGASEEVGTLPIVATPITGGGNIKVWNGSAWVAKPVKVWSGSAWTTKTMKFYNGSSFVTTSY